MKSCLAFVSILNLCEGLFRSRTLSHTHQQSQPTCYPVFSSWQAHPGCQPTHYPMFSSWQTHTSCQPTHYNVFSSWQTHTCCQPTHYPVRLCSVADKHTSCQPTHYTVFSSWQTTPAVSPHTTLCSVAVHRQDRNQTCTVQIHTDKTETRPIPGRSTQTRQETGHVPCTSTHARQKTGSWMTYRSTQAGQKTDLQIFTKTAQSVNLQNYTDTETQQKNWCVDRHKTDL